MLTGTPNRQIILRKISSAVVLADSSGTGMISTQFVARSITESTLVYPFLLDGFRPVTWSMWIQKKGSATNGNFPISNALLLGSGVFDLRHSSHRLLCAAICSPILGHQNRLAIASRVLSLPICPASGARCIKRISFSLNSSGTYSFHSVLFIPLDQIFFLTTLFHNTSSSYFHSSLVSSRRLLGRYLGSSLNSQMRFWCVFSSRRARMKA